MKRLSTYASLACAVTFTLSVNLAPGHAESQAQTQTQARAQAQKPAQTAALQKAEPKVDNDASTTGSAPAKPLQSEIDATAEPPSDDPAKQPKGLVVLRLYLPQMKKRTDTFSLNPYTTDIPTVAIPQGPLPDNIPGIRDKVIQSGYSNRLSLMKPYPDGGWRWNYAYRIGLRKSHITEPHAFFQIYNFSREVAPYVQVECKRINKIEKARTDRYFKAVREHEDNAKDEEMEALRLGLEPIKLEFLPVRRGEQLETSLYVAPGDWWVTGTHKVPGLIYYWQEPIKVKAGQTVNLDLTDANALLIQGGW